MNPMIYHMMSNTNVTLYELLKFQHFEGSFFLVHISSILTYISKNKSLKFNTSSGHKYKKKCTF
jgi:hypothetical protein